MARPLIISARTRVHSTRLAGILDGACKVGARTATLYNSDNGDGGTGPDKSDICPCRVKKPLDSSSPESSGSFSQSMQCSSEATGLPNHQPPSVTRCWADCRETPHIVGLCVEASNASCPVTTIEATKSALAHAQTSYAFPVLQIWFHRSCGRAAFCAEDDGHEWASRPFHLLGQHDLRRTRPCRDKQTPPLLAATSRMLSECSLSGSLGSKSCTRVLLT